MKRDKIINKILAVFFTILSLAWILSNGYDLDEFIQRRNNYYYIHGV